MLLFALIISARRVAIIRGIATRAARRALPSRQYGLLVKCGPVKMRARAVGRKVRAAVLLCVEGGAGSPSNNVVWAEDKWYSDPSSGLAMIDIGRKVGMHIFNRQKN